MPRKLAAVPLPTRFDLGIAATVGDGTVRGRTENERFNQIATGEIGAAAAAVDPATAVRVPAGEQIIPAPRQIVADPIKHAAGPRLLRE